MTALDQQGQQDLSYNGAVTITILGVPTGGHMTGTLTGTFVNGIFTFSNLKLTVAGPYTLKISSGTLPPITIIVSSSGGRFT